jgi:hypothetical protein
MAGIIYSLTVRTNYIWDVDHVELANQAVAKVTAVAVRELATD